VRVFPYVDSMEIHLHHSAAEVTIHIKNFGEEAYKASVYGDKIIITRRFTKEGASTWKIQDARKRVVTTKREELAAICDHMNIQVDNPINILTQGRCARRLCVHCLTLFRCCEAILERIFRE
jgi:chromosome segregation ATPase